MGYNSAYSGCIVASGVSESEIEAILYDLGKEGLWTWMASTRPEGRNVVVEIESSGDARWRDWDADLRNLTDRIADKGGVCNGTVDRQGLDSVEPDFERLTIVDNSARTMQGVVRVTFADGSGFRL